MAKRYPSPSRPDQMEPPEDQLRALALDQDQQQVYGAAANSGATVIHQTVISGDQYNIHGDHTNIHGNQTNYGTIQASHTDTHHHSAKADSFNLKECQEELIEFYLNEMGKVQLLPWMPKDTAEMDSIFVDFDLIKQDVSRSTNKKTKLDSNENLVSLKTSQGRRVNRVLIQGEAGSGKSTTAANIVYKWALQNPQSPLSQFSLVFMISMHEIQDSNASLEDLIFEQILPEDSKVSKDGLQSYIKDHAADVLILLDGLDEDSSGTLKNKSSPITKILHNRKLRKSCVILTTRPHRVDDLGEHQKHYTHVKLTGFSKENIMLYIRKFFHEDKEKCGSLNLKLQQEPHIMAMAATPVLLLMICLLWYDQCSLPDTKKQLYQRTIKYLWNRYQGKEGIPPPDDKSDEVEFEGELGDLLNSLGETALKGITIKKEEKVVFNESDFGSEVFNLGCRVGIISKERLRSKLNRNTSVTFLHKSFQDFFAGVYLANLLETDKSKFYDYLGKLYWFGEAGLVCRLSTLDFCCGTKPQVTFVILEDFLKNMHQFESSSPSSGHLMNMSINLGHIFESQLSCEDCLKLVPLYSNARNCVRNASLTIWQENILPVLYQLKLWKPSTFQGRLFFSVLKVLIIRTEFTTWLPSLLEYTTGLARFDIALNNTNKLDPSLLDSFYRAVSSLPYLKYLTLERDLFLDKFDITGLLNMLSQNKECKLSALTLHGLEFDCKTMVKLLTSQHSMSSLSLTARPHVLNNIRVRKKQGEQASVSVKNVQEQPTVINEVIQILPKLQKLDTLQLSIFKISGVVKNLKSVLPQLKGLSLTMCLGEKHLNELISFLPRAKQLTFLDLSRNQFSLSSLNSLIRCLKEIPQLEKLHLQETNINDHSACTLATELKEMTTIQRLDLSGNPIGQKGKDALKNFCVKF